MKREGLIYDETDEVYFASKAYGSTSIKAYDKDKRGFYLRYIAKDEMAQQKRTTSLAMGTLVDALMTGGDEMPFVVRPEGMKFTTKAGKEWKAEQTLPIVSIDDLIKAEYFASNLQQNECFRSLTDGGDCYYQVGARTEIDGVMVQAKLDILTDNCIIDVKTSSVGFDKWIRYHVYDYGYDIQAPHYQDVVERVTGELLPFYFAVTMTVWPFATWVIRAGDKLLAAGLAKRDKAIAGISAQDWGRSQTVPMNTDSF